MVWHKKYLKLTTNLEHKSIIYKTFRKKLMGMFIIFRLLYFDYLKIICKFAVLIIIPLKLSILYLNFKYLRV